MVGCFKGPLSWVTALSWVKLPGPQGGALALTVGTSDGGVSLWGSPVQALSALAPLPSGGTPEGAGAAGGGGTGAPAPWRRQYGALERWGALCAPDLRAVTTLAACVAPVGAGALRLLVAAGKSAGALAVWQSADLAPPSMPAAGAGAKPAGETGVAEAAGAAGAAYYKAAIQASCQGAGAISTELLHSPYPITGLTWAPVPSLPGSPGMGAEPAGAGAAEQPPAQAQAPAVLPLLCSSSRDGAIRCWQLSPAGGPLQRPMAAAAAAAGASGSPGGSHGGDSGVDNSSSRLRALPEPQPCARRKKAEAGRGVMGLAASPNGLFVASVAPTYDPSAEFKT